MTWRPRGFAPAPVHRARPGLCIALLGVLPLAAGCLGGGAAQAPAADGANGAGTAEASAETAAETGGGAAGDAVDELFADALHEGVAAAAAGTAYIEVERTRLEFGELTCEHHELEGGDRFRVMSTAETEFGPTELVMVREIGPGIGWSWEDEYVQLTFVGGTPDRELNSISIIQHERERGGAPEWDHGDGASPVIRVVGDDVTAAGRIDAAPFAEDPLTGEFTAAANCA